MQLGRYSVSTLRPPPIHSISFSEDGRYFAVAGKDGYEVWKSWPLGLVRRRVLPGTLSLVVLLPHTPLVILQGGGATPLYSPNKAVIYHDKLGTAIAELEFGERIRGISARRGLICICLSRKAIAFEYGLGPDAQRGKSKGKGKSRSTDDEHGEGFWLNKVGEWETVENELGLMALSTSPGSSLLALPGRQAGHVQLISLPPCPPVPSSSRPSATAFRSPIILAHTHALSTLSTTPSGSHLMTTSERGTLLRIWDTSRGRLERELRRGVDRAEMWGAKFDVLGEGGDEKAKPNPRIVGWSDKGTVHVWGDDEGRSGSDGSRPATPTPSTPSLTHILSRNLPLPKYFSSTASFAQYHLPRKNPHAISTALGAAGVNVPSMKNEDGEESERFVVGWVGVEVDVWESSEDKTDDTLSLGLRSKGCKRTSGGYNEFAPTTTGPSIGMGMGIGMGTRDERRSFESDGTSRTATPPLRGGTPTPASIGLGRRGSSLSSTVGPTATATVQRQSSISGGFINKSSAGEIPSQTQSRTKPAIRTTQTRGAASALSTDAGANSRTERQLVAITYSGDWYRLRIAQGEEERRKSDLVLVEYRRLGVGGGGGGW